MHQRLFDLRPDPDEIATCGGLDTNKPDNWLGDCIECGGCEETKVQCPVCDSEVCCA